MSTCLNPSNYLFDKIYRLRELHPLQGMSFVFRIYETTRKKSYNYLLPDSDRRSFIKKKEYRGKSEKKRTDLLTRKRTRSNKIKNLKINRNSQRTHRRCLRGFGWSFTRFLFLMYLHISSQILRTSFISSMYAG